MLTVTPNPLVTGGTARVCVSGSSHTQQTIHVIIDDGEGNTDSLPIALDANGDGCADWTVADWEQAKFNFGTCAEVFRAITASLGG